MPKFHVTDPQGKAYEITAPDGATQDQVLAYAKQHFGAPPPQPEKKGLLEEAGDAITDIPKEIGHQFMEGGRAFTKATREPIDPGGVDKSLLPGAPPGVVSKRELSQIGGLGEELGALPVGLATSVLGRPIETMTKGRVPREVTGNVASMAVPVAGELTAERSAASLASKLGVGQDAAKTLMSKLSRGAKPPSAAQTTMAGNVGAKPPSAAQTTMAGNVGAMDRLGIKPSSIVASPHKDIRQAGNLLGQNLAMGAPVRQAVRRAAEGVKGATAKAATDLGSPKSTVDAGNLIKGAVKRFAEAPKGIETAARSNMAEPTKEALESQAKLLKSNKIGFGRKASILYDRVDRMIPAGQLMSMPETQAALNDLRLRVHDPAFMDFTTHPEVLNLSERLEQQAGKMTFDGARKLRTIIRETLRADPALKHTASDAEIERLYNAMSRDLSNGAERLGGPEARRSFEQTDRFYRAGRQRIERSLNQVFDADSPNQVFHDMLTDAQEGKRGDLDRLMQLRRSLKPDEWRDVAASVLDSMGRALPGQRTHETDSSFRTFLTNFNKLEGGDEHLQRDSSMADSGLKVLFDGAGHQGVYQDIKDIARVTGSLREVDKLYNHSMSGSNVSNMMTAGAAFGAASSEAMGHPIPAIMAMLAGTGGLSVSKVLESPSIARYLAGVAKRGGTMETEGPRLAEAVKKDATLAPLLNTLNPTPPEGERQNP